eukprot:TRINITY_DN5752_c0_g1_i1.p1 TRINITY_DN5752_c0_g1~~TRINITY_DN5752_c0_g1_i1.p1  ORF type:complete len:325 (-),score=37.90 TRINITY_DN5752_c0_g1_i1:111-1085(-)
MANADEIGWDQLDMGRFAVGSTLMFLGTRTLVYPFSLVKTRLQVQEKGLYNGTSDAFVKIAKAEGIRGFYKGFVTVAVGIVPAQGAYITGYELVKSLVEKSPFGNTALANFLGGAAASLASATVGVPLDVISSRLMLQSPSGELTQRHYKGGMNALTSIFANEGIRGLYRGYGASLITYAPTSAVWWLTYGLIRPLFYGITNKDPLFENIAAGFCGAFSGATAAFVTNPLDVAKTRLQTQRQPTELISNASVQQAAPASTKLPRNIFSMLRYIGANEGLLALWKRGLMARMVSMAINGSILILTYENVKKFSLKPNSLPIKHQS